MRLVGDGQGDKGGERVLRRSLSGMRELAGPWRSSLLSRCFCWPCVQELNSISFFVLELKAGAPEARSATNETPIF
jgi:hypothetical protein